MPRCRFARMTHGEPIPSIIQRSGPGMIKFCIFAFPRSGSTYLCSRLNAHPDILCHYEVFHPDAIGTISGFADRVPAIAAYTTQSRDSNPAAFLADLFKWSLDAKAVGFKIFVGHSTKAHELILKDKSIVKIILERSTLDAYVSMIIAKDTGHYTSVEGPPSSIAVPISAGGLLAFDAKVKSYLAEIEAVCRASGQRYLKLRYDDVVADEAAMDRLFEFLGIERGASSLTPWTERQNSQALEDKVSNLHELVEDLVRLYRERT